MKDVQRKLDLSLEELVDETKGSDDTSRRKRRGTEVADNLPPAETEGARKTGRPPKPVPKPVPPGAVQSPGAVEQQAPTMPKAPRQTPPLMALAPTSCAGRPPPPAAPMGPPGYAPHWPHVDPRHFPPPYRPAGYAPYARPPAPAFRPPPLVAPMPVPGYPPPSYAPPGHASYGMPPRASPAPPVGVAAPPSMPPGPPPSRPVSAPPGWLDALPNSAAPPPPPPGSESSRSRRSDRDRDRDRHDRRHRDRDRDRDRRDRSRSPAVREQPVLLQAAPMAVSSVGFQVRLANIPEELTARDLAEAFGEISASPIEAVDLLRDGAGRPTGEAIMIFGALNDAQTAVRRYHGGDLNGRRLEAVYEGEIRTSVGR